MRLLATVPVLAYLATSAFSQMPDVKFKLDARFNYRDEYLGSTSIRAYDLLGHLSTVGLLLKTDTGLNMYVTERLEEIPNAADNEPLDEYYVQNPDHWQVGKQYIPFGRERLIRESVLSVRSDAGVHVLSYPVTVAACDGGSGHERGVVLRVGDQIRFSGAIGRHFGIGGTSLDYVRRPENGDPLGAGYKQMFDMDIRHKDQNFVTRAEILTLAQPEAGTDHSDTIADVSFEFAPRPGRTFILGVTHDGYQRADFYRAQAHLQLNRNLALEPMLRFRNGLFYDFSVALHVKL